MIAIKEHNYWMLYDPVTRHKYWLQDVALKRPVFNIVYDNDIVVTLHRKSAIDAWNQVAPEDMKWR